MFERLLTSFQNILKIPELRTRILFTMGMLVVYRIGAHIPTPGINGEALSEFLQKEGGALLGFLDIFSGGSLSRLTILALGIMPYISASIILQLLTVVVPHLVEASQRGRAGSKKDYSIHSVRDNRHCGDSGIRDCHGSRTNESRRICDERRVGIPSHDGHHLDGRYRIPDVAR